MGVWSRSLPLVGQIEEVVVWQDGYRAHQSLWSV